MKQLILIIACATTLAGCNYKSGTTVKQNIDTVHIMDGSTEAIEDSLKKANALQLQSQFKRVVRPKAQTVPVDQANGVDAADDPAIWFNTSQPGESRILGTDKQAGLALYNLQGELIDFKAAGRINNVDLRYNFPYQNKKITIAAASERNNTAIVLFEVNADSLSLLQNASTQLDTTIIDDAYGCCMYYSQLKNAYYVFIGGKNGNVQQWRLQADEGKIGLQPVRQISFASQCEGMVADDETSTLYVAEEGHGIWKLSAEEDGSVEKSLLDYSDSTNTHIAFDLEGLDIYYAGNGEGYLIASVQGNFSYAVFEKQDDNRYLGNFVIKSSASIDGVEETDGLAVSNLAMAPKFPNGLLVVQDGFNTENDTDYPQNFKLVDWADIGHQFNEPLKINTSYVWWQ